LRRSAPAAEPRVARRVSEAMIVLLVAGRWVRTCTRRWRRVFRPAARCPSRPQAWTRMTNHRHREPRSHQGDAHTADCADVWL